MNHQDPRTQGIGGYDSKESEEEHMMTQQWRFQPRQHHHDDTFKIKIDFPQFDGELEMEDLLDWFKKVNNYFEYTQTPEKNKVKLVAYRFNGGAFAR